MSFDAVLKRMREKMPEYVYEEAVEQELGMAGRMLSGSKRAPEGQEVYWNACVFNDREQQVWHGDFNLTRDREKLQRFADRIGPLYLTPEQPFRFEGLKAGRKSYAAERIVRIDPVPLTQKRGGAR